MTDKLTNNPDTSRESLEKSLPEITALLRRNYDSARPMDMTSAVANTKTLLSSITEVLKKNGIAIGTDPYEIMAFFSKQKMSFTISPIPVGDGKFLVNTPLYRLGKKEQYDMSSINFPGLPRIREGQTISEIGQTIIPDIGEKSGYMLDGLTIQNPKDNSSTVLLFPDRIRENAKKANMNEADYRKIVAINEVSQVYFSRLIPTALLPIALTKLAERAPSGITLQHLEEAFSDLCSMKFAKGGKYEILRILSSTEENYRLSKMILVANLKLYFPTLQEASIPEKIKNMNPTEFSKLNTYIIEGYEENTLPTIKRIYSVLNEKK